MQENKEIDDAYAQSWLDELITAAVQDDVTALHFEVSKHAGQIRQRTSSGMALVADGITLASYEVLIKAIKARFKIDKAEWRRPQDGRDRSGLIASLIPTTHGQCCCISFQSQYCDYQTRLKFESRDAAIIQSLCEKRSGLVFVYLDTPEANAFCRQALEVLTGVFADGKILFAGNGVTEDVPTVDRVLYAQPWQETARKRQWFDGLLLQQPDVLWLPYGQQYLSSELCRYAEEHVVVVDVYSRGFLHNMSIPPSWLRKHCRGLLKASSYPRICQHCRTAYLATASELRDLKLNSNQPLEFSRGAGCVKCNKRGVKNNQLSLAVVADGASMASLFGNAGSPDFVLLGLIAYRAIRRRNAELAKDGLIPSYPALRPRYDDEEIFEMDQLM